MAPTATTPAALVPALPDVLNRRRKHIVTDLLPGDQLHFTAAALGFPKGLRRPVYGYTRHTDAQGQPYAVTAYVQPLEMDRHVVAYDQREAHRYPTRDQKEIWFGAVLLYLVEVDLTDYADCLRLERLSETVLLPLYAPTPAHALRQAA